MQNLLIATLILESLYRYYPYPNKTWQYANISVQRSCKILLY